ncbi:lipopolysaccharide biosynthesis glycosyltransferase [Ligilactobacillus salitolerans]|uniref:Lipopolysaccharide biosynthesis glycosyltransferase n=1 Tax=Ligilactobacillus salitolerans TaxID=1808352 RepID=A0A401IUM8_9LACO|nr:glycosyltransferase family 8 protein [Ligilactobacillus salitolerans]GBG95263.1 lipopolysaccharide biosynthesis glycosyltransferase [Ligilactobacillus salitolerans]
MTTTPQREVPIFFSIDDKYAPYLSVALLSLIDNSSPENLYKIHVLYQTLSETNRNKISALVAFQPNISLVFISLKDDLYERLGKDQNTLRADYQTLTIYYRLFIADMFPQYDKGIYLDADIVVNQDIAELYRLPLEDRLVGVVQDAFISHDPVASNYAEQAVGVNHEKYFNSGVLLLNLTKLRTTNFSTHFLKLMNQFHFQLIAPDQDYLNAICSQQLLLLENKWNYQTEFPLPVEEPVVIHYNLFGKPWCYDEVPYGYLFWKYAKDSAFLPEINQIKDSYVQNPALAQHDAQHKDLLVQRLGEFPGLSSNMKKEAAKGVQISL